MTKILIATLLSLFATIAFADYANDRAEIENMSNKYLNAIDAGDVDTAMAMWVDDGTLEWSRGTEKGKDSIRKAMAGLSATAQGTVAKDGASRNRYRHFLLNHVIDVTGNTAKSVAYWFNMTNATPQKNVQVVYMGHYEDELVKINGKWFFKKRRVFNESLVNKQLFYPGLGEVDPRTEKK
jgi:SnoaL-like domain